MKSLYIGILSILFLIFTACEEKIEIDLNAVNPKVVIEAHLKNTNRLQEIFVTRTVNFDERKPFEAIEDANVVVRTNNGRVYSFISAGNGRYIHNNMTLNEQNTYTLEVSVENEVYTATSNMPSFVEIDSLGITKENIFNETYYFVNLKFHDIANVPNYYLYTMSVNDQPFKFNAVFSDKFNDGLNVTHQLGGNDLTLISGDQIKIRRHLIAKDVHKYWSDYQSTNPGSASPGNPTSNISNGALGYFSVSNVKEYSVEIQDQSEELDAGIKVSRIKRVGN